MNKTTLTIHRHSFAFDESRGILTTDSGTFVSADVKKISEDEFSVLMDGSSYHILLSKSRKTNYATINNSIVEIQRETVRDKLAKQLQHENGAHSSAVTLRAPMPGLIAKLLKSEGTVVNAGEGILVVEAMKMENEIKTPKTGTIKKIFVKEKQTVEKNDTLFTVE